MRSLTVMGLNSGTSMDGVDAALFTIGPSGGSAAGAGTRLPRLSIEMIGSALYPFDPRFSQRLQALVAGNRCSLEEICRLNVALAEVFAGAARQVARDCGVALSAVDLIGSHGQTIWHSPAPASFWGVDCRGSLQLGDGAVIAERTGVPVISDFRAADLAAGGQGAPLVAFADEVLFGQAGQATGVLNIGGIANITVINRGGEAVLAFDTGPGNMLIDRAAHELFGCPFDAGGSLAASGQVDSQWLDELLQHGYFSRRPPKTTGREEFGQHYADELLRRARGRGLSAQDTIATLTALTAACVAGSYSDFIEQETQLERLILGGGGADNKTLVRMIESLWPHKITVLRHEDSGFSSKFKEALLFALLAYTTYFRIPNNVPRCTGARRRVCLGKLSLASHRS